MIADGAKDAQHSGQETSARHLMIVDGKSVASADGRYIDVENPATRTLIGQVPRGGEADVDAAVRAAFAAFESWRQVAPRDRGRLLSDIADAVEGELEPLSRTVALETPRLCRSTIAL